MLRARLVVAALLLSAASLAAASAAPAADPPRYKPYYDIFDRGTALIPHHDTRYVAQGLAYWAERDALAISYYDTQHTNDSTLEIRPLGAPTGPGRRQIVAPNLFEGLAIAGNELHVVYEAAAAEYADATYRVRTIHHGPLAKLGGP